ncbi:MAG: hypothetical protein JXR95_07740 [Deltaproteobacteria bacterium]|nr:hypothetical protein [Deltaproteobacteria bacterium]
MIKKTGVKSLIVIWFITGAVFSTGLSSCTKKKTCPFGQKYLDKKCVCKLDSNCPEGMVCIKGSCTKDKSATSCPVVPCPKGQVCDSGVCRGCKLDKECKKGSFCDNGECKPNGSECSPDHDCPIGQKCKNGYCVKDNGNAPSCIGAGCKSPCNLSAVYFDYKASKLGGTSRTVLKDNIRCLNKAVSEGVNRIHVMGLCDPRGPTTFNDDLSSQRIKSVMDELTLLDPTLAGKLTITTEPLGETCAVGTDEQSWKKDRRVEMVWFKKSSQVCP